MRFETGEHSIAEITANYPVLYPYTGKVRNKYKQIKGYFLIDSWMVLLFPKYSWNKLAAGYILTTTSARPSKYIFAHRLILEQSGTELPNISDHKNRIKYDNRLENIRPATYAENRANAIGQITAKHSKYIGVSRRQQKRWSKRKNKWVIYDKWLCQTPWWPGNPKYKYTDTEEEAARIYDSRRKETFGEYALLNFPEKD